MSRRIVSATDYGFRKVIRVVMDDAIPEWVHPSDAGAPHTPATARGPGPDRGTRGPLDPSLDAGTECHSCVFNHDMREFIFTGEELQVEDPPVEDPPVEDPPGMGDFRPSGTFRNKTHAELVVEIQLRLLPVPPPVPIGQLTNQII